MKKLLSFLTVAVIAFGFSAGAQAATYSSIDLSSTPMAGNVDLNDVLLGTGSAIVAGDTSTHRMSKYYSTTSDYLTVYGGGNASYTLTAPQTTVAFNWGTVDGYNTLKVTNANNETYSVTGSDILGLASTYGLSLVQGASSVYVTLTDLVGILSVQFLSTSNSFEVADISAVPLPGALLLFGSALFGTAAYRRRRGAGNLSA